VSRTNKRPELVGRLLASVVMVGVMALTGACGGGGGPAEVTAAATTAPSTSTETTTEISTTTSVDPAVEAWIGKWQRKIVKPMRKAAGTLIANAVPALEGNSAANFRLDGPLTKLSNCKTPLEIDPALVSTPSSLSGVRALTIRACKRFYVGVDTFVKGLNNRDRTLVDKGIALVKKARKDLAKAESLADQAQ
jgi:hypothetical protein